MKSMPEQSADDRAGLDMLIGYAVAHRIPAQTRVKSVCRDYPFGFERFMAETIGAIRYKPPGEEPLATFARPMLAQLLEELNLAQLRKQDDYEQLHEIRIVGKRLRYAMEIFVDCFGPALRRQLCPVVGDLQEILGSVNDHFVAAQLYSALDCELRICLPQGAKPYHGLICRLLKYHESQMVAGREKFDGWWDRWQQPEVQLAVAELCGYAVELPTTSQRRTTAPKGSKPGIAGCSQASLWNKAPARVCLELRSDASSSALCRNRHAS